MSQATILIADDDAIMRRLMQHYLQQAGYRVLIAINGAEAIETSQAEAVDLVITDLYMPFFNGLEVRRQIHAANANIPVIMISGRAERLSAEEVAASGVYAWLAKPIDPNTLLTTVRQALDAEAGSQ
jgi:CheY-like chemotaxis protein